MTEPSAPKPAGARPPAVPSLVARAARLHYEFSLTHQETAAVLGVSRVKVTRLLKQAREAGIVMITVLSDLSPFAEVEERLAAAVGLRESIVVPAGGGGTGNSLRSMLARGAASYLERVVRDGLVVAVGLSRTDRRDTGLAGPPETSPGQLCLARGCPSRRGSRQR